MASLPRFIVLESQAIRGYYLSITADAPENAPGFMKFDDQQVLSPRAKFAVEQASDETGTDGRQLVHIRSCYNNKYWVAHRLSGYPSNWIVASAENPEEDQSKTSCTLFEPVFSGQSGIVNFRHVQTRNFGMHYTSADGRERRHGFLLSNSANPAFGTNLRLVDWGELVILPPRVTFRSEELDGNYLCSRVIERFNYQRFEANLDIGDPLVAKELFVTNDGNYRIKDGHFGKFWRRSPNWIWADAEDDNNSNDTLFSFVRLDNNVIALRNLGNNNFCGGLTTEGKTNCLNAQYPTISRQTRLVVEERVLSREIYGIRYRLSDSRIYQEQIIEVDSGLAVNNSPDRDSTVSLRFMITDSRTRSWNGSVSLTLGVKTTLQFNAIPLIFEGKIEISTELTTAYEWGETTTVEYTREATYTVVVPPLTTMRVTLMASRAFCDVPFSYTQRDVLTDGRIVTQTMDDGLYTGINAYNFHFESVPVGRDDRAIIYK